MHECGGIVKNSIKVRVRVKDRVKVKVQGKDQRQRLKIGKIALKTNSS